MSIPGEMGISAYPVAIIQSRYSGTYEGGKWHSIPRYHEIISLESYEEYVHGDDCSALDFWGSEDAALIGVGDTPELAITNMWFKISVISPKNW